jgi:hypothetical protein
MTTKVTVEFANHPVYVYEVSLDENMEGESRLVATVEEGIQTFYVHQTQDIIVTENKLD